MPSHEDGDKGGEEREKVWEEGNKEREEVLQVLKRESAVG